MRKKIKVGLVDDDFRTTRNLYDLLTITQKVEVCLIADTGMSFLEKMNKIEKKNQPDIVLMDVDMPEMSGIDTVLIGKAKYPNVKFLMLTIYDDEEKLFEAIKAGANGYLLKDEKVNVLIEHMEKLMDHGGAPMSPLMAQKTLELLMKAELKSSTEVKDFQLSEREKEVLRLMVDGKNYKEIASDLFISNNTVRKHTANIYEKLHVTSKASAIKLVHFYNLL